MALKSIIDIGVQDGQFVIVALGRFAFITRVGEATQFLPAMRRGYDCPALTRKLARSC